MAESREARGTDAQRDPHVAVREAEGALRELVRRILQAQRGDGWLDQSGLTDERLEILRSRRTEEGRRRLGQTADDDLLSYADLSDLGRIIVKHWESFSPVLGAKKTFDVFIDRLEALRNPDAHHRSLWPYEVDLVFGISGYLRQLVATSRASEDTLDQFWPRFESVTDNFGNKCIWPTSFNLTGQIVHAGDELSFQVAAWTPAAKPLEFSVSVGNIGRTAVDWTTSHILGFRLLDDDIERAILIYIRLRQPGVPKAREHLSLAYIGVPRSEVA
jgi:hypothetical protein